jgi:hypothetical protein
VRGGVKNVFVRFWLGIAAALESDVRGCVLPP